MLMRTRRYSMVARNADVCVLAWEPFAFFCFRVFLGALSTVHLSLVFCGAREIL